MIKKIWLPLMAACLLITAAGCETAPASSSEPAVSTSTSLSTAAPTTTTAAPTTTTTQAGDLNPLTGVRDLMPGSDTRPVAVMIGNDSRSRPQCGIEKADMYIETETEGGITRLMAVFTNASRIPAKLGPVRSARSPFALLAQSLDAVYIHAGGSSAGLETIRNIGLSSVNALSYDGTTFWRDAALRQSKGLEYSMLTSGDKLASRLKSSGYRVKSDRNAPFLFEKKEGTGAGQTVQVVFSGAQSIWFQYDAATGLYMKNNGKRGGGSPHKSADGVQISAANVLVMYDQKYAENNTTINFRLSSGNGLLVSGGTSRAITWSRTNSQLSFKETDGSALKVSPGKTYICLAANAGSATVT